METFLVAVERTEPALIPPVFVSGVARQLDGQPEELMELLGVLLTMRRSASAYSQSAQDFANTVATELLPDDDADKRAAAQSWIGRALTAASVQVTAKALEVTNEHPRLYAGSRVLSDIRALFVDEELAPRAAVVLHQLKLSYFVGSESLLEDFFLTMDCQDLEQLKATIERALQKHQKLVALADRSNLPVLNSKEYDA